MGVSFTCHVSSCPELNCHVSWCPPVSLSNHTLLAARGRPDVGEAAFTELC